ncbi:hypothetical protein P153DRAFT_193708 [Dothidotthia symphoricarpi CBS 119687]|uniref:Uncharacterized protein n=1 Tax=Dothidotthia symphoricarpi CBS 119687 TaxID=1392245 RepID=A0A6A6ALM7_9PLEO|nr:uncharacterized protein P153DRAFT_193708 [Dothidotthia symphoricarpi CBS 119687]KAF2131371.1 hypothetical protein P153DRAFT_193708 [Dothidotthia symphoricarpi CBS 119687]
MRAGTPTRANRDNTWDYASPKTSIDDDGGYSRTRYRCRSGLWTTARISTSPCAHASLSTATRPRATWRTCSQAPEQIRSSGWLAMNPMRWCLVCR